MTVKFVLGGGALTNDNFPDDKQLEQLFTFLKEQGVTTIDTARLYAGSEEKIGSIPNRTDFTIDTKLLGGFRAGSLQASGVVPDASDSLKKVNIPQFDILYIHAPDPSANWEEVTKAFNEAHKKGIFKRFGLSNFTAEQVQHVYDICKKNDYVLPSVYQGNYSAVARKLETLLFPTLRKLNIAFYAYSPIAGGFLTKTKEQIEEGVGRWSTQAIGGLYRSMYNKPSYLQALDDWNHVAEKEGVTKAELAYRWVAYHSALKEENGDAVIFGARTMEQATQTVASLKKGPLSQEAQEKIEEIWKSVEKDAPVDNYSQLSMM